MAALDFVGETPVFAESARTRLLESQSLARTRVQNRESSRLERGRREQIDARRVAKGAGGNDVEGRFEDGFDLRRVHMRCFARDLWQSHLRCGDSKEARTLAARFGQGEMRLGCGREHETGKARTAAKVERALTRRKCAAEKRTVIPRCQNERRQSVDYVKRDLRRLVRLRSEVHPHAPRGRRRRQPFDSVEE